MITTTSSIVGQIFIKSRRGWEYGGVIWDSAASGTAKESILGGANGRLYLPNPQEHFHEIGLQMWRGPSLPHPLLLFIKIWPTILEVVVIIDLHHALDIF